MPVSTTPTLLTNTDGLDASYPHKLSLTEAGTLTRCKRKYYYAYQLGLVAAQTPSYFAKGKYLHLIMQEYLTRFQAGEDNRNVGELGTAALMALRDARLAGDTSSVVDEADRKQINAVLEQYFSELDMSDIEVLGVELEFLADIGLVNSSGQVVPIHGFIDAVLRTKSSGDVWLVEHKTASRAWSQGQYDFSYQPRVYTDSYATIVGERPVGTLYNFFYPKRFETTAVYVTPEESKLMRAELQQIVDLRDNFTVVREPHWGCNDCVFRDLCVSDLVAGEGDFTLGGKFVVDQAKADRFSGEE